MYVGTGAMLLSAAFWSAHPGTGSSTTTELTLTDFDDTISYSTAGMYHGAQPVPVHEFDETCDGQGAEKVIDGPHWLNSDGGSANPRE